MTLAGCGPGRYVSTMRSNDVAAEGVQELADLLAISGGDPYRVRAYEKAARSVAGYALTSTVSIARA